MIDFYRETIACTIRQTAHGTRVSKVCAEYRLQNLPGKITLLNTLLALTLYFKGFDSSTLNGVVIYNGGKNRKYPNYKSLSDPVGLASLPSLTTISPSHFEDPDAYSEFFSRLHDACKSSSPSNFRRESKRSRIVDDREHVEGQEFLWHDYNDDAGTGPAHSADNTSSSGDADENQQQQIGMFL